MTVDRKQILVCWYQVGPYHLDRLAALTEAMKPAHDVIGIEIASGTTLNLWRDVPRPPGVVVETLFPDSAFEGLGSWAISQRLLKRVAQPRVAAVFFLGYQRIENLLAAWLCRLLGRRAILMTESKFDDFPRSIGAELVKCLSALPYQAALVGGRRHREYVEFLGMRGKPIAFGYDTVSRDRMRATAGREVAPAGTPFADRVFLAVARFVTKKNLPFLITAHSRYTELAGADARRLVIVGEGSERPALLAAIDAHTRSELVELTGALQSPDVSRRMASALALCVPSTEEQWGLVVNEAVFLGLPLLVSSRCGSVDSLARNGLNGFVLEPDDLGAWVQGMLRLSSDEAFWAAAARSSAELADRGDTRTFATGAASLLRALGLGGAEIGVEPANTRAGATE
jgi:L-malate glycosyltransferase